jgi:type I restriction enzyme M protein
VFEQTFRNIDDVLWKEAGCTTELDYVEQTSWLLFLKYLDDLETNRALEADLAGRTCTPILDAEHRWGRWAAPKDANGKLDHNRALTGPDLIDYVNRRLFPYLQGSTRHLGLGEIEQVFPLCAAKRRRTRFLQVAELRSDDRDSEVSS